LRKAAAARIPVGRGAGLRPLRHAKAPLRRDAAPPVGKNLTKSKTRLGFSVPPTNQRCYPGGRDACQSPPLWAGKSKPQTSRKPFGDKMFQAGGRLALLAGIEGREWLVKILD